LSKAALAAGTTSTLVTTGTTLYSIRSKAYSKAALANAPTPTTDAATGNPFLPLLPNNGCVYLVGYDAAGNVKCVQGTIAPLDAGLNFINAPNFGSPPNDFCPIGYIMVKAGPTAAAGGWVFGTSANAATGVTQVFQDVICIPDRPQIA
jgi:hypothetical protein